MAYAPDGGTLEYVITPGKTEVNKNSRRWFDGNFWYLCLRRRFAALRLVAAAPIAASAVTAAVAGPAVAFATARSVVAVRRSGLCRGRFRSRTKESILEEARLLAASGVKELIIVAQDITRYGIDLYGKVCLTELLKELCKLDFRWVRLHYLYPELIDDELIDEIASEDKIVKYLDIPIQHINDTILRRMNRRGTGEEIRALFKKLRERIPGLVLRTSLITGLPGEGEAEFEELCDFLREAKIERAGVFPYSPEEGTPAALMPDRCSTEEAQRRAELCMEIQAEIMDGFAETFIGRELDVLVMGREPDGTPWGRSEYDSPDIDSRVIFSGGAAPGDMVRVRIDSVDDGELIGEQI